MNLLRNLVAGVGVFLVGCSQYQTRNDYSIAVQQVAHSHQNVVPVQASLEERSLGCRSSETGLKFKDNINGHFVQYFEFSGEAGNYNLMHVEIDGESYDLTENTSVTSIQAENLQRASLGVIHINNKYFSGKIYSGECGDQNLKARQTKDKFRDCTKFYNEVREKKWREKCGKDRGAGQDGSKPSPIYKRHAQELQELLDHANR